MKKFFVFLSLTLAAQNIFAGSGGYWGSTCSSGSGRTVLTSMQLDDMDSYSSSNQMSVKYVNLIIDGVAKSYVNGQNGISLSSDELTTTVSQIVKTASGSVANELVRISKIQNANPNTNAVRVNVRSGADPRLNSAIDGKAYRENLSVELLCKSYSVEP